MTITVICSVARTGARPILFLPRGKGGVYGADLPKGEIAMHLDTAAGPVVIASVAKVAINVARGETGGPNLLPGILKGWFGEDAGAAGTARFKVSIAQAGSAWVMSPVRTDQAVAA